MEPRVEWSTDVGQADWIRGRLAPFDSGEVTSVVPGGFPAYARVLHPARDSEGNLMRWSDVASRNGVELRPAGHFPDIALLPPSRSGPGWQVTGPQEGTLCAADAATLVDVLRRHTATPDDCWFCLWDGYGWGTGARWYLSFGREDDEPYESAEPARAPLPARHGSTATYSDQGRRPHAAPSVAAPPHPVPRWVRDGPRVELPDRSYFLYRGAVEHATAFVESDHQTPNLWWPEDRSWCVATEIDLEWTYVAGSVALVEELVGDRRLEAWPSELGENHHMRTPAWLTAAIDEAATRLLAGDPARVETSCGTVAARLRRPGRLRRGALWTTRLRPDGSPGGESWTSLSHRSEQELRSEISHEVAWAVIDLLA